MKKIFVTVAEFEENGGILKDGRDIYNGGLVAQYQFNHEKEDDYKIFVSNGINSGTVGRDNAYVQINCTPHYI